MSASSSTGFAVYGSASTAAPEADDASSIRSVSDYGADDDLADPNANAEDVKHSNNLSSSRPPGVPARREKLQAKAPTPALPQHTPAVASPPLRPQRSVRSFMANGSKSPPMSVTPGDGRSPRPELVALPPELVEAAAAAAAASAPTSASTSTSASASVSHEGLGIRVVNATMSPNPDDLDPALIAQAEAEAVAEAEAESRPRTLSGVRALAKERARLRKEAALAALNASTGVAVPAPPSSFIATAAPENLADGASSLLGESDAQMGTLKAQRRLASRQDTAVRDVLQTSLDTGVAPTAGAESNNATSTFVSSPSASPQQQVRSLGPERADDSQGRRSIDSIGARSSKTNRTQANIDESDEFAKVDAALTAVLDDLSLTSTGSAATVRANAPRSQSKGAPTGDTSRTPLLSASALPHASSQDGAREGKGQDLVFPDQGTARTANFPAPLHLPDPAALASRERPPVHSAPHSQLGFLPTSSSDAQPVPALPGSKGPSHSPSQPQLSPSTPASARFDQRRNTLPPPTDVSGQLLIYGKSIPFPEPYLNTNVPGMNAPERRRLGLGNSTMNALSISAPSSGLIHPTVERSKAYAAKANALFAIETGLEVWVKAMGATRPGARNAYTGGALPRRTSAVPTNAAGMTAGGPVSAAAAAFKQSMAGVSGNAGAVGSRQLASGRTQSVSIGPSTATILASASAPTNYAQFGHIPPLPGGAHPSRREDPSVSTIRSDITFPMRGDGGRAKDITPISGHGVHMTSSDSTESRGVGAIGQEPDSPPNALPRNLPYPGVIGSYQGRKNSIIAGTLLTGPGRSDGSGAADVSVIPPRGSSIDGPSIAAVSGVTFTSVDGAQPLRPGNSSASSSRRESLRQELSLGPAPPVFEPSTSHGPRLPRTPTSGTIPQARSGIAARALAMERQGSAASSSASFTPVLPHSGSATPRGTLSSAGVSRGHVPAKLTLEPVDPLGIAIGDDTIGATHADGWSRTGSPPDVATPGSGTTYMSAISDNAHSFASVSNALSASISSSSVPLSDLAGASSLGGGVASSPASVGPGRHAKVLGPRAPKLSLSGIPISDLSSSTANGSIFAGPSPLTSELGKRPSIPSTIGSFTDSHSLGKSGYLDSPSDLSPRDPSLSVLPGAAIPSPAGKSSPQFLHSPPPGPSGQRRSSAATGFIPVGVSSTVRKSSFGGKEVTHSRDFFYSDLGKKEGSLGDVEGYADEPIVATPRSGGSGHIPTTPGAPVAAGVGPPSLLSPPGTPGTGYLYGTSPSIGLGDGRARTLSRSGSTLDFRAGAASSTGSSGGLASSVDALGGGIGSIPRSPSLADATAFRANSTSSLSYGSVRTSGSGAGAAKKQSKKAAFEETLAKMQDVMPDAERDVLAKYLEKAGGNDLTAMHNYFADQAKGKISSSRSPRRSGY
ncbi:hypothetical protein OC846_000655 [Tilletia horrida]|uniref:Uncharacterized protein n=1 Tax=Tilletia horrida TaxID=155126 RepID=A0AAN6K0Q8_9BASI|nr:hypothetical protein OC846_000655 [Tilletia horrida]